MSAVADKLREARALIERGWTQEHYARGKSGRAVDALGKAAVCYCAVGALRRVNGIEWGNCEERGVLRTIVGTDVIDWNDAPGRTQAEVIAAFDRAIELAESGQ